MKFKGFVFALLVISMSCSTKKEQPETILSYFSNDAAAIVRINDMARFQSELKNNGFLTSSKKLPFFNSINSFLDGLHYVSSDASCTLAFHEVGKENFEFVLISPNASFFDMEKAQEKSAETFVYQNHNMDRVVLDGNTFFSTKLPEQIAVSSSQLLLENLIRVKKSNRQSEVLQKLYETADKTKSANFFINLELGETFVAPGLKPGKKGGIPLFSDWAALDFNTNQDQLDFTGLTVANDSTQNLVSLFKNAQPLANKTAALAPLNSDAILSFSIGDFDSFVQNQQNYLDRLQKSDTVFSTVEEIGLIYLNKQKSVVLNSYGTNNILEYLDSKSNDSYDYQGSEIKSLGEKNLISSTFEPLIKGFDSNYFTILENSFVFASDRETLQTIISNKSNRSTFDQTALYQNAMASLASESNILFVANKAGMDHILEQDFVSTTKMTLPKDYSYAAQLVADNGFYHTGLSISKIQKSVSNNSVSPLFTLELDSDLANPPQFVKNHRTNKQEIVVQDIDNNLYLISTAGKVLWKKQLNGPIQGKIEQVDLYKNGKLQLAFCTNEHFMIIDRNGEIVEPFDMDFEGGNLNPLAVFDYEKRKDYRFVVTQGQKIFMYNRKGEIVNGFRYTEAESPIVTKPSHFKLGQKDYLVFQLENGSLKIRHRAGGERIKVNRIIDFSDNDVFLYKNKFSITDKKGVLHQVDANGKLSATNFNLGEDHGMYATSKTLALMNENVLSIKGKKTTLDMGVYTAPRIFYIYDKIYVGVTDLQSQKIYLFDSQAKSIANFPVYGSSMIDLVDMDNDRKLEFVAKDQENSLIAYKIN